MSDRSKLLAAMTEAERFIAKARDALESIETETYSNSRNEVMAFERPNVAKHAAAKRASLDLTRALADFRRRGE